MLLLTKRLWKGREFEKVYFEVKGCSKGGLYLVLSKFIGGKALTKRYCGNAGNMRMSTLM